MPLDQVMPWLETAGVIGLAVAGLVVGYWCARRGGVAMVVGYLAPLFFISGMNLASYFPTLEDHEPFHWLNGGFRVYAVLAPIVTLLLGVLIWRIKQRRLQWLVGVLMVVAGTCYSVLPFLLPAFNRGQLLALSNQYGNDGVSLQNTGYTCGPAAAVTGLEQLGIHASEGELAVLSRCNWMMGTTTDALRQAILRRYQADGVRCEPRRFRTPQELRDSVPFLAQMKFSYLMDHFVAVLDVTTNQVTIGDPLWGRVVLSWADFENRSRGCGLALSRIHPIPSVQVDSIRTITNADQNEYLVSLTISNTLTEPIWVNRPTIDAVHCVVEAKLDKDYSEIGWLVGKDGWTTLRGMWGIVDSWRRDPILPQQSYQYSIRCVRINAPWRLRIIYQIEGDSYRERSVVTTAFPPINIEPTGSPCNASIAYGLWFRSTICRNVNGAVCTACSTRR